LKTALAAGEIGQISGNSNAPLLPGGIAKAPVTRKRRVAYVYDIEAIIPLYYVSQTTRDKNVLATVKDVE
jgi:hypothetical protein